MVVHVSGLRPDLPFLQGDLQKGVEGLGFLQGIYRRGLGWVRVWGLGFMETCWKHRLWSRASKSAVSVPSYLYQNTTNAKIVV